MKVVLFCGGLGSRLRDGGEGPPKPMTTIGHRPILWHVMRYYAHFGHTDFILCLGYGAKAIKRYFLDYEEEMSNDFVLTKGGETIELASTDISDWRISFVDTGHSSSIGERLARVRPMLEGESLFLANYGDVLTDVDLHDVVNRLVASDATASLLAVPPQASFHTVSVDGDSKVRTITSALEAGMWVNGGYFVFRPEIFDVLGPGEDLVEEPFTRLAGQGRLLAYPYDGFWVPMDTIKDRQRLEELDQSGRRPWALWEGAPTTSDPVLRRRPARS